MSEEENLFTSLTQMFNYQSDDLFSSSSNSGRRGNSGIYRSFIPRGNYIDQVVLGEDAYGRKIFLDASRY